MQRTAFHPKPHIKISKGHAVNPLGAVLIGGAGIMGEYAQQGRSPVLGNVRQQLLWKFYI